jgi:RHS repeat-associated protein
MTERTAVVTPTDVRYGFQGQEEDDELWSGAVSFKYRVEDARLGRFFSVDPKHKEYPWNSTYAFSENRLIDGVELEGLEYENFKANRIVEEKGLTALWIINTDHGYGPIFESTYSLELKNGRTAFDNLKKAYSTDPASVHDFNNKWANYEVIKNGELVAVGDHMKITVSAMGVDLDIYVRFTEVEIKENSFQVTAATLYGHTDAGFITFSGSFDPNTGLTSFSIYNKTTNNVGLDLFGVGRNAQDAQWKQVLNNAELVAGGVADSKERHTEIYIEEASEGSMVKVVDENLKTGESSETIKAKM